MDTSSTFPRQHKHRGYLNHGKSDEMEIYGFERGWCGTITSWIFTILTLGILQLIFYVFPKFKLYATHKRTSLERATMLLIHEFVDELICDEHIIDVVVASLPRLSDNEKHLHYHLEDGTKEKLVDVDNIRSVTVRHRKYIWNHKNGTFVKLAGLDVGVSKSKFHDMPGYTHHEQRVKRHIYGWNAIEYQIVSLFKLIIKELLSPFFIFQELSLIVWILNKQWIQLGLAVSLGVLSVLLKAFRLHRVLKKHYHTVTYNDMITIRDGPERYRGIPASHLVPGDIIVVPEDEVVLPCDAVVLDGHCIVNESVLTGESTPQHKTPLPNHDGVYDESVDSQHTLYQGTKLLQSRPQVISGQIHAVVLRTGYLTRKAGLLSRLFYSSSIERSYQRDSIILMLILIFIGLSLWIYRHIHNPPNRITFKYVIQSLSSLADVVPVALPSILSLSAFLGVQHLLNDNIICTHPEDVTASAIIDCVVFDKTGTLTEIGVDMRGVLEISEGEFQPPLKTPDNLTSSPLLFGMASCHTLHTIDRQLTGSPLDVKMFRSIGWNLVDNFDSGIRAVRPPANSQEKTELNILHVFEYKSMLKRMSVITQVPGSNEIIIYCKGSADVIPSLCVSESVPEDYSDKLEQFTSKGLRVIAIAWKTYSLDDLKTSNGDVINKLSRKFVESGLTLCGFFILDNKLKPESSQVIDELHGAKIRTIMCTGDNLQTASSVGIECGILLPNEPVLEISVKPNGDIKWEIKLPHNQQQLLPQGFNTIDYQITLTGDVWKKLIKNRGDVFQNVLMKGCIFAGMTSEQKQQLVVELQRIGYSVAMCGDGANDCAALLSATIGISLTPDETSFAAPFTSLTPNIRCVPRIIREGRATTVSGLSLFKLIVQDTLILLMTSVVLSPTHSALSKPQSLLLNLAFITKFAKLITHSKAYQGLLSRQRPVHDLLSPSSIMSLVLRSAICLTALLSSYFIVRMFNWFKSNTADSDQYENFSVFTIVQFELITTAIVFSKGRPFVQPLLRNPIAVIITLILLGLALYILFYPAQFLLSFFEMASPPLFDFQLIVLGLAAGDFLSSLFCEKFIIDYLVLKKFLCCAPKLICRNKRKYRRLNCSTIQALRVNLAEINNDV